MIQHINKKNKQVYIGKSNNFQRRLREHRRRSKKIKYNTKLYQYIRKCKGFQNFSMCIIHRFKKNTSKINILKQEKYYIKKFKASLNMINPIA